MPRHRKAAGQLAGALEDSARPIYLLDQRRIVLFCNTACADWAGIAAEQLIGQECHYHAPSAERDPAAVAARLCPPPEAFSGQPSSGLVSAVGQDGQLAFRLAEFLPITGSQALGPLLVIAAQADMTETDRPPTADGEATAEQLHAELLRLRRRFAGRYALDRLLGPSSAAGRVRAQVQLASGAPANVLVIGPAGSGKQHVAKAIHYRQPLDTVGSLVPLACSALDGETLLSTLESMLAKAAAVRTGPPVTLLLSDVDLLPLEIQPQLVRMLKPASVPRVISTACRPLAEFAGIARFHPDLLALLSTLTIELLPLARRIDDLPLLAQMFLEELNADGGRQLSGITPEALEQLADYPWPGNLDELALVVREAHAQAAGSAIGPRDLPKRIHLAADAARRPRRPEEPIDLVQTLERLEADLINRALERAKGNKSRAAELLGLTRPRLYRRLVQLGLGGEDGEVEFQELD